MKHMLFFAMSTLALNGTAQTTSQDETAINAAIHMMEEGWNAKSGKLFARPFAQTHDYIVVNGLYLPQISVEGNAEVHQRIFDTVYKNNMLRLVVDKVKFIRPDLALVHVFAGSHEAGTPEAKHPTAIISGILEKQGGEWKIISFHNCNIEVSFEPGARTGSPKPLTEVYASWYNVK